MSGGQIPGVLADALGVEGAAALSAMLESAEAEWKEDVLVLATERFERTLSGQISALRMEVTRDISRLREEVTREISTLRVELARQVSDVLREVGTTRVDLLKWSFLFWVGQVAVMAGLLAFMLRFGT